jgi:hypothetical protein
MKKIFLQTTIFYLIFFLTVSAYSQVQVNGYFKKNGTYVMPHYRSSPDGNPYNNYSFPGNINPYTGKVAKGNPNTYLFNYYNKKPYQNNTTDFSNYRMSPSVDYYEYLEPYNDDYILDDFIEDFEFLDYGYSDYFWDNNSEKSELNTPSYYTSKPTIRKDIDKFKKYTDSSTKNLINFYKNKTLKIPNTKYRQRSLTKSPNQKQISKFQHNYYIILCSESTLLSAKESMANLQSRSMLSSYNFKIFPAIVKGKQWYRIAVGEFKTFSNAKERMNMLSLSLPPGAWIGQH